jgi:hypothetical protein
MLYSHLFLSLPYARFLRVLLSKFCIYSLSFYQHYAPSSPHPHIFHYNNKRGLISLWFYKENNTPKELKKMYLLYIFPLSSTHLWLCCSNFFNPSKKNYFSCAVNRKIENRKNPKTYQHPYVLRGVYTSRIPPLCNVLNRFITIFVIQLFSWTSFPLDSPTYALFPDRGN